MLVRVLRSIPRFVITSTHNYFYSMEQPKEIRYVDYLTEQYGDYPFIQSTFQSGRKWTPLGSVDHTLEGQEVIVRARVHNVRGKGNNCFIVLR